ncbi:MAG: cell division topological specificity factor MinE [Firmicutes bacterium]|jgi:cell division topological specificity factor|nr:cell division topological specificity factor MinE [Bacillota bacterium]
MFELLGRLFGREGSKDVAKERLRLVLVHDRSQMSPQLLENLKNDLLRVIGEYMEIEPEGFLVDLQTNENQVALVANIPVRRMKRAFTK